MTGDDFDYGFSEEQAPYTAAPQLARVWTEGWVLREMYCPSCGEPRLNEFPNNTPVADFYCTNCQEEFELKSKNGSIKNTVPDGAYGTMMARLQSQSKPSLMLLRYDRPTRTVRDLAVIPKQFFIPELIKKTRAAG